MQDRYFGDVGDYGKYGLLRALTGTHPSGDRLSLGIVWYLTDDESHNNDGKHVRYLGEPRFGACDEELFRKLGATARLPRSVGHVPQMAVFSSDTVFFDKVLNLEPIHAPFRQSYRSEWYRLALEATANCEVIFCDPDNGIASRDESLRLAKGAKSIGRREIAGFYSRGQSVVVYHHADRSAPVPEQAARRVREIKEALGTDDVFALRYSRGTTRLYFVAPSTNHSRLIRARTAELVAGPWGQHFSFAETSADPELSSGALRRTGTRPANTFS